MFYRLTAGRQQIAADTHQRLSDAAALSVDASVCSDNPTHTHTHNTHKHTHPRPPCRLFVTPFFFFLSVLTLLTPARHTHTQALIVSGADKRLLSGVVPTVTSSVCYICLLHSGGLESLEIPNSFSENTAVCLIRQSQVCGSGLSCIHARSSAKCCRLARQCGSVI